MRKRPTPVPFPAGGRQRALWGFDAVEPVGQPLAWIHDWDQPAPGFGVTEDDALRALAYEYANLSDIRSDEVLAAHSIFKKLYWHTTMAAIESAAGSEATTIVARAVGKNLASQFWSAISTAFGPEVPVERIAWGRDATNLVTGTGNKEYTWFDESKVVSCRTNYYLRPPTGLEATTRYSDALDDAYAAELMEVAPGLRVTRIPAPEVDEVGHRMIQIVAYDEAV